MDLEDVRTDEDKIIETILIEGNKAPYDDSDFLPIRQSLYSVATVIPEYDDEAFHRIVWRRPQQVSSDVEYFAPSPEYTSVSCRQGTLPDEVFLGTLMAVCVYPGQELLENIFASRPEDFKNYGVFTCRFYVEGEWVEVITDTHLPCARDELTGACSVAYGRSVNPKEMWISLAEKAYAKAVGSYEAIQKVRIHEALLHLTGGSVQQISLHDDTNKEFRFSGGTYKYLSRHFKNDTLILMIPAEKPNSDISTPAKPAGEEKASEEEKNEIIEFESDSMKAENMFHANRIYSVVTCRDIGGFELMLIHCPWGDSKWWRGSWSDRSTDWDLYPEIQQELEEDPTIPWKRERPNGYFWMNAKNVIKYFNTVYLCKLFPNNRFNFYCVRGEWRDKTAGGVMNTIRDKALVAKDAVASRHVANQKATAAVVVDGDPSWFNNPQLRVHTKRPTTLFISLLPASGHENDLSHVVLLTVTAAPMVQHVHTSSSVGTAAAITVTPHPHIWDASQVEVVASLKPDGRVKGQEASLWSLELSPKKYYHVVLHTLRRGLEGAFIVRLYSQDPIVVEKVPPLITTVVDGHWVKSGDIDSAGGPLKLRAEEAAASGSQPATQSPTHNKLVENTKWCQNPQFHLEVVDPYGSEEIHLKVVVRRTDKGAHAHGHKQSAEAKSGEVVTVGFVACKAECLEDNSRQRKKNQPRQNALGELIASKASSLQKKSERFVEDEPMLPSAAELNKVVLRKTSVGHEYHMETSYTSRTEACLYFPRVPRSWMPNGLIIVPCLSDRNVKGAFDIEVYSSEEITLRQLPDSNSRSVAGAWAEGQAGGSHLCSSFKKNPKFTMTLRNSSKDRLAPCAIRITLSRTGPKWRSICKKDTLGSMIGFYIFLTRGGQAGESHQVFESTFVPTEELSTDPSFTLNPLASDEEYTIMPTTFGEGIMGSFVLSVMSEHDFTLKKDK